METPLSTRRLARSQALTALSNSNNNHTSEKTEDPEKELSKSRPKPGIQDPSPLIDITNDSPIVGLARGRSLETPNSSATKQKSKRCKRTPGSGEALLRGQVKNLLQRVEEEADISKFSLQSCSPLCSKLRAFLNFPAHIRAPTPPNITRVSAITKFESFDSFSKSPIEISEAVCGIFDGKHKNSEKDEIARALFLDFSEKSEDLCSECSSVLEDDNASMWSIQVNVSTRDKDEQEDEGIEDYVEEEEDEDYGEEGEEEEGDKFDELCEGISKISVNGAQITFKGKHRRFVYNSDDELVEEHRD